MEAQNPEPTVTHVSPGNPDSAPPQQAPLNHNPLKVPASVIIRKDRLAKPGTKTKKTIHVLSRLDLTKEMMTVNTIIGGINLVDTLGRPQNPQLHFQVQGTHWVLNVDGEVVKFAEEDIFLTLFDVMYNGGFEMVQQYDQQIHSSKGMGENITRESWLFQRVRAIPVFHTT